MNTKDIFAALFEFFGSFVSEASYDLYDFVYQPVGFIMLIVTLLSVLSYYIFFDRPRFHRWWHWLIVVAITAGVMFGISLAYIISTFNAEGLNYRFVDYLNFLIAVSLVTSLFFTLFSLVIKRFSVSRAKTPF